MEFLKNSTLKKITLRVLNPAVENKSDAWLARFFVFG
jgi:hypothetical protein